ncbi:MAG: PQQ-dependent sugar dehydrogenase [Acidimicrobiales bacterium]
MPGIVWYGTPNRSWVPTLVAAPPAQAQAVVSDLDGNGGQDIFFNAPGGGDALFNDSGQRSFVVEPASVADKYEAFVAGDFDANGSGDLVLYDRGNGFAVLWWGSRSGRSGGQVFIGAGFELRGGDFDGSGTDDLLWYTPGDGPDAILYGRADRSFLGAPITAGGNYQPFVGDFDGDRRDDVFWYTPTGGEDLVWFFRPSSIDGLAVASVDTGGPDSAATVADIDGDGDDDALFLAPGTGFGTWWYGGFRGTGQPAPNLRIDTMASGLTNPWDIAFTPDGAMLFTERPGRLWVRVPDGTVRQVSANLGDLFASGETGFMGLAVDPAFTTNRRIYTCQGAVGPQIKVVAWSLDTGLSVATWVADPLVGGLPVSSGRHGGCRLRFDATGALLVGTGDAAIGTNPQDLTSLGGKVLRINAATGGPAAGNPFLSSPNPVTRLIYSYGHRNVQGLAVRPGSGDIYEVEHGPSRDDEVNVVTAGANYGWDPVPGYNEGVPMTFAGAVGARWSSGSPTVAPSGAAFIEGKHWRGYEGALAVATLRGSALRLQFYDAAGNLAGEVLPPVLNSTLGRLRAATMGPDGALYLSTDNGGGGDLIVRVFPS